MEKKKELRKQSGKELLKLVRGERGIKGEIDYSLKGKTSTMVDWSGKKLVRGEKTGTRTNIVQT